MKKTICSFCNKEQSETFKLIANPDGNCYICDECVKICLDILKEENENNTISLTKPDEIKKYLDRYVINQENAKKIISVAVYNHYKKINYNMKSSKNKLEKSNILLVGPTGSGKTLLCKSLAKFLNVPFAEADATTLTEAGYVGDDVESVLTKLLQNADFDVKKAEKGIVYIDEIDKISKRTTNRSLPRDPTGEGVQQALLKIIEGKETTVPINFGKKGINQETVVMDTSQILFICGGAFVGLDKVLENRINKKHLGFINQQEIKTNENLLPQDLIEYGIIPEFVGRLPIIIKMEELKENDLVRILTEPENNLVNEYKTLFKLDGVDIDFKEEVLIEFAKKAYSLKAGARGLRNVFENEMLELMYTIPQNKDLKKILIENSVLDKNKGKFLNLNG